LLEVPGKSQQAAVVQAEFAARVQRGEQFLLPATTLIETGNHIAQVKVGDRRAAAERYVRFVEKAAGGEPPWTVTEVTWDEELLLQLIAGDSTGQSFVDLAGNGLLGGGDVAILVESDILRRRAGSRAVQVWTLEKTLAGLA
ncbi:MAG: hypothetical protein ACRD0M_10280, partial [Acidimicrobiales bacterium]